MEKGDRATTFVKGRLLKGKVVVITEKAGLLGQEFVKTVIENHVYRDRVEVIKIDITSLLSKLAWVEVFGH